MLLEGLHPLALNGEITESQPPSPFGQFEWVWEELSMTDFPRSLRTEAERGQLRCRRQNMLSLNWSWTNEDGHRLRLDYIDASRGMHASYSSRDLDEVYSWGEQQCDNLGCWLGLAGAKQKLLFDALSLQHRNAHGVSTDLSFVDEVPADLLAMCQ